jgi:GNAT superfamily N-acetyltransferase
MITIREATSADTQDMMRLIHELANFEKASHEVLNTSEQLRQDGWGDDGAQFYCYVAEYNKEIVGIALFHKAYSTWKGRYIYLDDLIVQESYRNQGIGKLLFDKVIAYCRQQQAKQLRWHVLNWNESAIRFYKRYGAHLDPEWITCKLHPHQFGIIDLK